MNNEYLITIEKVKGRRFVTYKDEEKLIQFYSKELKQHKGFYKILQIKGKKINEELEKGKIEIQLETSQVERLSKLLEKLETRMKRTRTRHKKTAK